MNKHILYTLLLFIMSATSHAMIVQSQTALVIKEFDGKLYQMQHQEWQELETDNDLSYHEIKPSQWHKIISTGEPKLAIPLLRALAQFVPTENLQPYLILALKRIHPENLNDHLNVAQTAYDIWAHTYGQESAQTVRTTTQLRKHIRPDVLWKNLFLYSSDNFQQTSGAVNYLKNVNPLNDFRADDYLVNVAIRKIYLHDDIDDLKLWMNDDEFSVALGSWLALHRIAPEQFAKKILEKSIWWQTELEYSYGSGCVVSTGKLTPIVAALELFSDYLSMTQIHKALLDIPELWQTNKLSELKITNQQTFNALKQFGDEALKSRSYQSISTKNKYQELTGEALFNLLDQSDKLYQIDRLSFNQDILNSLLEHINKKSDIDHQFFIYEAFAVRNIFAKQYIAALVDSGFELLSPQQLDNLLLGYHEIWPQSWQDLKQYAVQTLNPLLNDIEYPSLAIKLQ